MSIPRHPTTPKLTIYTIGHSTREIDDFLAVLDAYDIEILVDVRSVPRSRFTPQFNSDALSDALIKSHITYHHLADLGGLRHSRKGSSNQGWHNASFRGYADYMQTPDFRRGISQLLELAVKQTAIMCAEAVPCGYEVVDIFDKRKTQIETMTTFARVSGTSITYPAEE
jgi:uncharacterized protein (DUF488 family)